jgi:hypothetical protein
MVPPALVEAKEQAAERIRKELTAADDEELDWGVVAIYTCTKSCGGLDDAKDDDDELGAYREEYAWRQPSVEFAS